jgi:hypothetical protein
MKEFYFSAAQLEQIKNQIVKEVVEGVTNQPKFWDRHKMAQEASVSISTIDRWVSTGKIFSMKIGGNRLFCPERSAASLVDVFGSPALIPNPSDN